MLYKKVFLLFVFVFFIQFFVIARCFDKLHELCVKLEQQDISYFMQFIDVPKYQQLDIISNANKILNLLNFIHLIKPCGMKQSNLVLRLLNNNVLFACNCNHSVEGYSSKLFLWNMYSGKVDMLFEDNLRHITTISIINIQYIAVGYNDGVIKIVDIINLNCILQISLDDNPISAIAKCDFNKLAIGFNSGLIIILKAKNGKVLHRLYGHINQIKTIEPLENYLIASTARDRIVKIWNVRTGNCINELKHKSQVSVIKEDFINGTLITGCFDGSVKIWDFESGNCICNLEKFSAKIKSIIIFSDKIVIRSADGLIKNWDQNEHRFCNEIIDYINKNETVHKLEDIQYYYLYDQIACSSSNGILKIFDTISNKFVAEILCREIPFCCHIIRAWYIHSNIPYKRYVNNQHPMLLFICLFRQDIPEVLKYRIRKLFTRELYYKWLLSLAEYERSIIEKKLNYLFD